MMRLSRAIVARLIPNYTGRDDVQARAAVGLMAGWTSVMLNCVLFVLKGALGIATGSVSLIGDAFHTLADLLTSLVIIFGFRIARKPPDKQHPFGHGRSECVAAMVIGVLLAVTAVEMITFSIGRIVRPKPISTGLWLFAVLVLTILLKEFLARFSLSLGKLIDSEALRADALHHRSDALSTVLVIVAFVGARWDHAWLDGAMGIGVAVLIGWAAARSLLRSINPLLGERAPASMYREIENIARAFPTVQGVHEIMIHRYGRANIISLHIEVPDSASPVQLHEMSEQIEERIARQFPGHAIVHVDPINREHEHYDEVQRIISDILASKGGATSFHDLRLAGGSERFKVVFDIVADRDAKDFDPKVIQQKILTRLRARFPHVRVIINIEPFYFDRPGSGS